MQRDAFFAIGLDPGAGYSFSVVPISATGRRGRGTVVQLR